MGKSYDTSSFDSTLYLKAALKPGPWALKLIPLPFPTDSENKYDVLNYVVRS